MSARARGHLAAVTVVVLAMLLSVAILLQEPENNAVADSAEARALVAATLLPLVAEVERQKEEAARVASGPMLAPSDPNGPSVPAAALARDTARPTLDGVAGGSIVIPVYNGPAPPTVAQRRASLAGFSIVPLNVSDLLSGMVAGDAQLTLMAPGGAVSTSEPTLPVSSDQVQRFSIPVDQVAQGWRLEAEVQRSGLSAGTLGFVIALLVAGVAVALRIARQTQVAQRKRSAAELEGVAAAALTDLSAVTRDSLDLAEVLPAGAAVLDTLLDLDGLTLRSTTGRPTFAWGRPPGEPVRVLSDLQSTKTGVDAGSPVEVALARGGRSLGSLRVTSRRDLVARDLRTLRYAAEILASAVANAEAYQHQSELITRMRRLDELKTVFVATASHELRTPVAAIVGYANMLNDSWDDLDPTTARTYADRVDTNARRLGDLVEHLLDFSRLEQRGSSIEDRIEIDLGEQVRTLAEAQQHLVADHQVSLAVDPGVKVLGSELAVERVLTNLMGNAAKYSPVGTTIRIRVEAVADQARLIVDDEGPGISAAERDQIFSRFFRGSGDEVTRTRGAGLGLAIVTEFAESMAGQVSLEEAPTGGARFLVTYPLHHSDEEQGER